MLRVVWICFAMMLAPALVHADMDDMGIEDMDDMGIEDMEDMTQPEDMDDMEDMTQPEDMDDMGIEDMELDLEPNDMADMEPDVDPDTPEPTFTIAGIVGLEDSSNLAGTLVTLRNGELEFQTITSVSGSFSILEVPRGFYDLEISREGYLTQNERVNLQASVSLEFQLLVFAESQVLVEVVSAFSTLEFSLTGPQTIETSLMSTGDVAVWEGTLQRGVWNGTVVADGRYSRQFQVNVGKNSEPISMRIFLDKSPQPLIKTDSGCGCATSSPGTTWLLVPFFLIVGWVRRRWGS